MPRPIGIFDSGIGGLSVVKEIRRLLPDESIVYFGDTARLPYGTKSKETIVRFSKEIVRFLLQCRVKLIVVACHTASSFSLPALKRQFDVPVVGVVRPGARAAVRKTRSGRIGVLGTRSTVTSGSYAKAIQKLDSKAKVFSQSCPLFVPLVEEGHFHDEITRQVAEKYLLPMKRLNPDTVVLGCTHYPLIRGVIQEILGRDITLIDSARETAEEVKEIIERNRLSSMNGRVSDCKFFVSDEPKRFAKIGSLFLKDTIRSVRKATL